MPIRYHFELHETIATIVADQDEDIRIACQGLTEARHEIEKYILVDPFFKTSFEPLPVTSSSQIINRMADAAEKAGVGPMAAVAGAVATFALQDVIAQGCQFCLIDNGGDIALIADREITIGLFAGESPLSGKYAFLLEPISGIYGICTSSATVGPSISLGIADSVTVFSPDPILADAVATSACNELTLDDHTCLEKLPEGIDGIFAVFGDKSVIWGEIPKIISATVNENLITAGGIITPGK
ncbi:MAG TPA: UPF0280 family protein [Methanospirillum sp.]|uniref:UPF0280 family protein n=1 Tax=Methanospirillum sp. TaxID=45200 RepID=UPI002B5E0687|nr:UPF0280 family protein [Methanospirillum sp.]HWQ63601.1 UPF0280 family protein [Methanospirillum sp.]